jgi:hypothetical protein
MMDINGFFFSPPICDVRWVGDHSQEDLSPQIWLKVREDSRKKLGFLVHFWPHVRTYGLIMATSECFFSS